LEQSQPWPVPSRIQDLIQARIASLGEEHRRALAVGAVIGRPFDLRLLRLVSGLSELQAIDAVDQVLRRGFLDDRPGGLPAGPAGSPAQGQDEPSLAFRHDYFQRVIYDSLSAFQRRALHRRAAGALLQLYQARPQIVTEEVAHHYEQAGDSETVTYLAQAARQARELYAYQHAAELCSRALNYLITHQPDDLEQRFDMLLVRETILERQGHRAEQASDVAELKRLAEAMGDTERMAMASVHEAGFLSYTGQYSDARQAGERALALYRAASDPVGEGQALRELGFLSWSSEDYSAALTYGRVALQLHRRLGDVEGEATALHNLAEIHRSLGSPRQSLAHYENALELYWARQDRQRQGLTLYGMGHALRQLGDLEGASLRYRQALEQCKAAGDRLMASRVHHALASVYLERGDSKQALDHMRQAVDISREIGHGQGIAHSLVMLSDLQSREGRLEVARQHLEEAIIWLRLTEDQAGLDQAQVRLHALEQGVIEEDLLPISWIRTHVALAEGKVYCAFESPVARCSRPAQ
jgi:tetratricopeptide (TPR) repeat protein